jgi:DnaK suppressor protein
MMQNRSAILRKVEAYAPLASQSRRMQRVEAHPDEPEPLPPLTPEQRIELRADLEQRRGRLVHTIYGRRQEERATDREVGDEMDDANQEGVLAMTSRLIERDARLISEIDHALAKLDNGAYGLCEGTGEPIGYDRLRLRPWARYSVSYQEELERQSRTRGRM